MATRTLIRSRTGPASRVSPTDRPRRSQTRTRDATPPARQGGGTIFLLPPWTRAPLLAFRHPAVILAVVGAAAILACASSSASLFLSSSSSEALQRTVTADCPDSSHPTVTTTTPRHGGEPSPITIHSPADLDRVHQDVPRVMAAHGLAPTTLMILGPGRGEQFPNAANGNFATKLRVLYRDGATDNITELERVPGNGLLLPREGAQKLHAAAGDSLSFGGARLPVVGVYENLDDEAPRDYWCSFTELFTTFCFGCDGQSPPPPAIFTDSGTAMEFFHEVARQPTVVPPTFQWTSRIQTDRLTLSAANEIEDRQEAMYQELGTATDLQVVRAERLGQLPGMTDRVELIRDGLAGPVVPIAIGGAILALLLVGAAGGYWADRRAREVRLLSSRGVGPGGLAAKAALELTIPAAIGTVLGVLLAWWLVRILGPSPDLDESAPRTAAVTAAVAFGAGALLLAFVAGLRARNATERPVGARRSRWGMVPWELLLLGAAMVCYLRLRDSDAIVLESRVAQVNLLLMVFPLLFLAGAAILTVRLLTLLLRPLRRRSGRWPVALYLAVSRITAAPAVSVTLLAAISMPVAMMVYSAGLTATSQYTVDAKAKVLTGSDTSVISVDEVPATPEIERIGTIVTRYDDVTVGDAGTVGTLLGVNPATLPDHAFWDDRFSDRSLDELMGLLVVPEPGQPVPAILVKASGTPRQISARGREVAIDVVAHATAFPGLRRDQPLVVVNDAAIAEFDESASRLSEVWSTRGPDEVAALLAAHDVRILTTSTRDKVLDIANFLAVTWSFGYLQALAVLVGVVAVGGLLLYLETRQRSRQMSYVLSRRMGLSGRSHLRSMLAEMGLLIGVATVVGGTLAWLAVLMVYGRMDISEIRPPAPLLTVPGTAVVGAILAAVLVCVLAAGYAHRSAQRADVSEVLRLG